jgi:methyltransferase family protein
MEYLEYFERFPNAYAKIVESLNRVETLCAYLEESGLLESANSVLTIGCGDGAVEVALAKKYGFSLGLVEPAETYMKSCLSAAEAAGVNVLEYHTGSFECYNSDQRYDLVLSLYSWFAFEFDRAILEKALAYRKKTGKLLICLQGEASPSTQISALSRASGINLTSEKISTWAREEGFSHQSDTYHGVVASLRYLEGDGLSATGRDLVSFLLATPWEDISPELKSTAVEILQSSVKDGWVNFESPCLIF